MPITHSEAQITEGLIAVIAWAGNCAAASRALKSEKGIVISAALLNEWIRGSHTAQYMELREKYAAQLEAQLIHEYRDVARQAVEVQRMALDRTREHLMENKDNDPSRTAANAARVAQAMTDKMLSLSGRPTSIREDRNLGEILRSLAAKGIIELPPDAVEESPALQAGSDDAS